MAVFLINQCKFENCGLIFNTLSDLIQHIEDIHIGKLRQSDKNEMCNVLGSDFRIPRISLALERYAFC